MHIGGQANETSDIRHCDSSPSVSFVRLGPAHYPEGWDDVIRDLRSLIISGRETVDYTYEITARVREDINLKTVQRKPFKQVSTRMTMLTPCWNSTGMKNRGRLTAPDGT